MKRTLITLLSVALLAGCSGKHEQNNANNDAQTDADVKTIESTELFKDLKGDIALANQNLLDKKIKLTSLLVFDSYIDTLGKRCLICVPYDSQNNKIGYLRPADANVGEHKMDEMGFWNPEEETDKMLGRTQYFYNGTRLGMIYDKVEKDFDLGVPVVKENRITITVQLSDANDFTGLKLPTYTEFMNGEKHKHKAVFTQNIDVVGTVTNLVGAKNNIVANLRDCSVADKR